MIKTPKIKHISTNIIVWFIPLLFFIHNLEESIKIPQYLANQFSIHFISNKQFVIAICILTTIVLLCITLYQIHIISSVYWIIFIQGAIFFNAVQHIVLFFVYRSYNPGAISAFIIVLFSLYAFSLVKLLINKKKLALTLFFSLLSYPIMIWITLFSASFLT
ncbi:HXXEE domain-containing protein [Bacillus pseudomycoides]|uniref:HXXEE domain-containing protein n=1 Tax=Bacillus pseudomycoides TaxID=64104 RepID=UPI000BFD3D48|nr:HXXEE domain-containing protein [Bacillus pseudomycoides]PHB25075.1 HXXEE domain-containing protein [Bacillus pseudomycoides]